jgi:hypothetical protein
MCSLGDCFLIFTFLVQTEEWLFSSSFLLMAFDEKRRGEGDNIVQSRLRELKL